MSCCVMGPQSPARSSSWEGWTDAGPGFEGTGFETLIGSSSEKADRLTYRRRTIARGRANVIETSWAHWTGTCYPPPDAEHAHDYSAASLSACRGRPS